MLSSKIMGNPAGIIPEGLIGRASGTGGLNSINIRSVLSILLLFHVLILVTPVQAISTSLTPAYAYKSSTSNAYAATLDPSADATDFYFLNITIPAGYSLIIPPAGQSVGTYTMFNRTAGMEQVIIKIISYDPTAKRVDVNYSTDYGVNYNTRTNQSLSNIIVGLSILNITEPGGTTPGYFNLSLGGTGGPINSTHNNATLVLQAGTLRNPAATGNYNWTLEAKNNPAGTAFNSYSITTINSPPSNPPSNNVGGGGGGGGGGVSTAEPFDNILLSERKENDLISKKFVIYEFTTPGLNVYEMYVNGKENEMGVTLRVEVLKGKSELVKIPPPGIVYKNLNIWASSKRITYTFIRFKVENSWLVSNNIVSDNVRMIGWMGRQKWVQLETRKIKQDDNYTYYEVKSDTFGSFALTGLGQESVPIGTPIKITLDMENVATPARTDRPMIPVPIEKDGGFEFVLALTMFATVYMFYKKKI